MIRVLICCGGGFSSSAMAGKIKKEIKEKNLEDKLTCEFSPFHDAHHHIDECDIMMLCPHLSIYADKFVEEYGNKVPLYIFPIKMYGLMSAEAIYEDAEDILKEYAISHLNPFHFDDEPNWRKVTRFKSHRRSIK